MPVVIVCLLGFAISVAGMVLARRRVRGLAAEGEGQPAEACAFGWAGFFAFLQLFMCVYAALGLTEDDVLGALFLNIALLACVFVSLKRPAVLARLEAFIARRKRLPRRHILAVGFLFLAGLLAGLALEVPSNHDFSWVYPLCMLLEWALITAALCGLFFIFQRRGVAPAVLVLVLFVIGLAEYFIITFRSMPITPSDLTALTTAAAVSGGYDYTISAYCLYALGFAALGMLCCQLAGCLLRLPAERRTRKQLLVNLVVGLLCICGIVGHISLFDYYNTLGITVYTWRPLESYYRQGFLPTFISEAQTIKPSQPDGYSTEGAEALIAEYVAQYEEQAAEDEDRAAAEEQFDEEQPTVIVVMNETFCDLSIFDEMHAGYEGPEYFNSISDGVQRGTLYVSALGGGTANTEFEFLTGTSMAYLGSGMYPYTTYNLTDVENLAQQFGELGYSTTAMHPNHASNWNRENAYADLGFDEFLALEDFEGADELRGMVTDQATYEKVLELLEEDDGPQFIFDVTMQNHSGYDTGLVPYSMQEHLSIDGTTDSEVNEFVSLIQQSDEALEYLIEELEQLDRKVVLVFFGDHQPFFSSEYNDLWYTDEDDATHAERLWQTDYLIWANYDVAGSEQTSEEVALSANYLGTVMMDLIGAPLTDYQKACLQIMQNLPAINSTGFATRQQDWYLKGTEIDEEDGAAAVDAELARLDLWTMQYYQLFYDGKHVYTSHFQSEANETDPNLDPGTTQIK